MNLIDVAKQFGTQEACVNYLEALRWPEGVTCLQCDGRKVARLHTNGTTRTRLNPDTGEMETKKTPGRFVYQCQNPECLHQFSVTTGTIFHDTHLDLEKWFFAVALMVNAKKGLSALQMKRDLKVAYKTAWYLNHRIRKAMGLIEAADEEKLAGTIEADETYVGGKYDARRKRARYYLSEFQFRWNNREAESMFMLVMAALVIGEAIPYAQLIGKLDAYGFLGDAGTEAE